MSVELKQLLTDQCIIIERIAKVIVNYKKLSQDNVNYLYVYEETAGRVKREMGEGSEENQRTLPYFVQDHYLKVEEAFEEAADFLVTVLSKLKKVGTLMQKDRMDSSSFAVMKSLSSRLPRIDLPKFSGVYSEWESFCNTFGALVGSDVNITNMLKFHYLKSCVSGTAY